MNCTPDKFTCTKYYMWRNFFLGRSDILLFINELKLQKYGIFTNNKFQGLKQLPKTGWKVILAGQKEILQLKCRSESTTTLKFK